MATTIKRQMQENTGQKRDNLDVSIAYRNILGDFKSAALTFSKQKGRLETDRKTLIADAEQQFQETCQKLMTDKNSELSKIPAEESSLLSAAEQVGSWVSGRVREMTWRLESIGLGHLLSLKRSRGNKVVERPLGCDGFQQLVQRTEEAATVLERRIGDYERWLILYKQVRRVILKGLLCIGIAGAVVLILYFY